LTTTPNKLRVLIADDDALFIEALVALLGTSPRFEVVGRASNGRQAVELAEALQPDLILMDLDMPVMDGVEATRALLERNATMCVLAVSGSVSGARIREARAAGAAGYVPKSRAAIELLDAIGCVCPRPAARVA